MSATELQPAAALSRRGMLACAFGASLVLRPGAGWAAGAGAPASVAFQAWRNGRQIGEHTVDVHANGEELTATIAAHMLVFIGPIPIYRYRHAATEVWRGGQFASFQSHSVTNGRQETLRAERTATGVSIQANARPAILAPADAAPLTHWNMKTLSGPFFNPQTGKLMGREHVQSLGQRPVLLANGRTLEAQAFALTGEDQITDWYDSGDTWTGLRARVAMDGSFVDYRRIG